MGGRCLHVTFQVWIHLDSYSGYELMYMCVYARALGSEAFTTDLQIYTSTHDNEPELNDMSDSKPHLEQEDSSFKNNLFILYCTLQKIYIHTHVHV